MAIKISGLPTAISIDSANDYLPIVQSGVTNKISRNTFLGITGAPIGSTDTQTISNKTLGNTNTITILDSNFTLQDNGDNTKQAQFQISGNTTGTTRTYSLPNASVTLASLTGTEILSNKTITSPAITGGTIDNATITVDSISGHTTATIVTVANLQISNGVLNSANAVTATSIAAGAVQPQALVSGTGSGWAWQSWTPVATNFTTGNGTWTGKYIQIGKTVFFNALFTSGNTSALGTNSYITLPVNTSSTYNTANHNLIGNVWFSVGSANTSVAGVLSIDGTGGANHVAIIVELVSNGTYVTFTGTTSSVPATLGNTGNYITLNGMYQVD